jgi:thioesterase domain-containing protein
LSDYEPKFYSEKITLFRADDSFRTPDPRLGWDGLADEAIECHDVPGDHYSILKTPNVQVLAEKLRACLDEAENGRKSKPV